MIRRTPCVARTLSCLMATTALSGLALSGLILSIFPGVARAADECGAPVAGVVTCAKSGSPYAGGVSYTASGPLTVNIETDSVTSKVELIGDGLGSLTLNAQGTEIGGGSTYVGVLATHSTVPASGVTKLALGNVTAGAASGQGVVVMGAYAVDISADTIIAGNRGVNIAPGGAPGAGGAVAVSFNSMTVASSGGGGGVVGESHGDASILFGDLTVSGDLTRGLSFKSHGDMRINGGAISTNGATPWANYLQVGGDLDLFVESITTSGAEAVGLVVRANSAGAGGDFNVNLGSVTTNGSDATGVSVVNAGQVNVSVNSVKTLGGGDGVVAHGDTGVYVLAGEVETVLGHAIDVQALYGEAYVEAGLLQAGGGGAGVSYSARDGGRVSATRIEARDGGQGLFAQIGDGAFTANIGQIETWGEGGAGVYVRTTGELEIFADSVVTHGAEAHGLQVRGSGASTLIGVNTVETFGAGSHGVAAVHEAEGTLTLELGSVRTHGESSIGILADISTLPALTAGGEALLTVKADAVHTSGAGATGVIAAAHAADVIVDLGHVETEGDDATAVIVHGNQGVDVEVDSIVTHGARSAGLVLETPEADVAVRLGQVTTKGEAASGVTMAEDTLVNAISLIAGSIGTQGRDAYGVNLEAVETLEVEVDSIWTTGDFSMGAVLGSNTLTEEIGIHGRFRSIETAGFAATGVFARTTAGVDLIASSISTDGDHAWGAQVVAGGGGSLGVGSVTTQGFEAIGVYSSTGEADFDLKVGEVSTAGVGAIGVMTSAYGDTTAEIGKVLTAGEDAVGVSMEVEDSLSLKLGQVRTEGAGAHGLQVFAQSADIDLVGQVWSQGEADAVRVASEGDLTIDFGGGVRADGGSAVRLASGGATTARVAAGAVVHGRDAAFDLDAEGGVTLENAGHIASDTDLAILVRNGPLTLKNTGRITGHIDSLDDNAGDTIENSGEFIARGVSDFGGGEDVFRNLEGGVFAILEPQTTGLRAASAVPTGTLLLGLERFINAGTVSLVNGVAGDQLILDGVFVNEAGGVLQLDLDTTGATPVADVLDIGSLDGDLTVQLKVEGQGVVGDAGVVLLKSGGAQAGDELTIEALDGSFVSYTVEYDVATGTYGLVGDLAVQAYEPTKVATGAQALWRRGADVVSARLAQIRDDQSAARRDAGKPSVWAQAFSGTEDVTAHRQFDNLAPIHANLSHHIQTQGVQMGVDVLLPFGGGDLVLGASGGLGQVEQTFDGNGDSAHFDSVSLGAYAQWLVGPWSFGAMVKHENHDLTYRWTSADLRDEAGGETWGGRIEAAWRVQTADGVFFEPAASLSVNETDLDGIAGDAGEVEFGATRSVLGRIGARAGLQRQVGGATVQPFVGLHALQEFDGRNVSRLSFGGDVFTVKDTGEEAWFEGVIGVNVVTPSGLGVFAQGEAVTGDREGYALRIGARYNW